MIPVDENIPPPTIGRRQRENALQLGPRKKACLTDPLVHHGRHFGRAVHALCNVQALITNGLLRLGQQADEPEETFTYTQRREHRVFISLLQMIPGLEERLMGEGGDEEVMIIAELIQKGASGARSDDTKSIKGPILDWITPNGQSINPPLSRNIKADRGFHHERTGALLCPAGLDWTSPSIKEKLQSGEMAVPGDQWPIFLYASYQYDLDDPWNGLFRSSILVSAYKHVFTSPSSVEKEAKATRSGNARIHGMTCVTPASVAYIATQTRFALSSSAVFSRTDTITDSERFYTSVLDLFDDVDEKEEVEDLLMWWNRHIFPNYSSARPSTTKDSALARIREKRAQRKVLAAAVNGTAGTEVT